MTNSPWLDLERFATRRFLPAARRDHSPVSDRESAERDYLAELRALWSQLLRRHDGAPVAPDDVLVCASDREATELALGRLLQPDDVVLWAEPIAPSAVLATLAAGARYVDVGRARHGQPDAAALALALQAHPQAVFWGEAPSLTCADDLVALGDLTARACIADCTAAAWPQQLPNADASILALRDPDQPAEPVLYAVVTRPSWGTELAQLHGRIHLSERAQLHALAVLQGLVNHPAWPDARRAEALQLAEQFMNAAQTWPGAVAVGQFGLRAAVRCLGADPQPLAVRLHEQFLQLRALSAHPAGSLLWLDLCGQLPRAHWDVPRAHWDVPRAHWHVPVQTFDRSQGGG